MTYENHASGQRTIEGLARRLPQSQFAFLLTAHGVLQLHLDGDVWCRNDLCRSRDSIECVM